jgi:undecaprenyl pyrophosphate phosphatase UppP
MEFERLEAAWRAPANTPEAHAQTYLMEEFMKTLKARRRGEILMFIVPATAMTIFSGIAARTILEGRMDPGREWAALVMLGVCWLMLAAVLINGVVRRHRRSPQDWPQDSPMRDTLKAMLAANERTRSNMRSFLLLLPVFLVPMLFSVGQLHEVGKVSDRDAWQMLMVFGLALTSSVIWNLGRYFWVTRPEQRRLEELLREYEA